MTRGDYYDADGDGVEVTRESCPRCGDTFLAEHGDRKHCGGCGYTDRE
ncbi:MAG: small subunit ribosomal protein S27Ae [Methanobacteriota archaeon]|jgi:small subunit ribosomal protein S27Ae|uniref:Small ribosomal subunit protein eS31 n=1 Tax=Halorutilus salinus TaxID=2487751 RepID=A0A9Q4C6W8_9EURY|nr:30S ribosomal protein S27ae [Halorutilus salinus]MCX2820034.1 30S ribosomal protein S27ae [Halorutilus salinus]